MSCIFCRIASGEIPSDLLYSDEHVVAFRDIEPKAPVHVLIIPREHVASTEELEEAHEPIVGRLFSAARVIARSENVAVSGYRLTVNTGRDASQSVPHLHVHLMGGRGFSWPPG
ncbi:MAG: histidine triad nucleotide-binding protein [Chloroflexota bacterium]